MILNSVIHTAADIAAAGAAVSGVTVGQWILAAGDWLRWTFLACVAGDDLWWGASGYKMSIA